MMTVQRRQPCLPPPRTPARRRGAFTLIEILFAMAILSVGIAMAGAMLPAGIVANQHSSKDMVGTLICQNGLAIATATLTHSISPSEPTNDDTDLVEITDKIIDADNTHYPVGPDGKSGFLLLGKRLIAGENLYQLVAISYRLSYDQDTDASTAMLAVKTGDIDHKARTITFDDLGDEVKVGSPVVVSFNNVFAFARILKLDVTNRKATLDVGLPNKANADIWVVYERNDVGDVHPRSPGLTALTTITPLN